MDESDRVIVAGFMIWLIDAVENVWRTKFGGSPRGTEEIRHDVTMWSRGVKFKPHMHDEHGQLSEIATPDGK